MGENEEKHKSEIICSVTKNLVKANVNLAISTTVYSQCNIFKKGELRTIFIRQTISGLSKKTTSLQGFEASKPHGQN